MNTLWADLRVVTSCLLTIILLCQCLALIIWVLAMQAKPLIERVFSRPMKKGIFKIRDIACVDVPAFLMWSMMLFTAYHFHASAKQQQSTDITDRIIGHH
jgi:hypothetical protein